MIAYTNKTNISYLSQSIIDSFPRILKWKIIRLKLILLAPRDQRPRLTKLKGINSMFFILIRGNLAVYDALLDFSVWLRTGINPADNNRFGSHIRKTYLICRIRMLLCICVIKSYLEFLKIITKPLHKDYFFPFIKSNRIIFTRELHYLSFQYFKKFEFSCRLEENLVWKFLVKHINRVVSVCLIKIWILAVK